MADVTTHNNTIRPDQMELLTTRERIPERVRRLEKAVSGGIVGSGTGGGGGTSPPAVVQAAEPIPRNDVVLWVDTDDVPPLASPIPFVSALPGSPSDTTEIYFQTTSMATDGVIWHLRYRTASSSAYKWEVVGGSALFVAVETSESSGAAAFGDLATVGPSITVPLAGDYEVRFGSMATNSGPQVTIHGLAVGATAATDSFSVRGAGAASIQASSSRMRRLTGLAAATALVSKYRVTASTGTWEQRWLEVRPVRVG